MDQQQLEQFIQAITEEVISYLGGPKGKGLIGLEIDELVCPGCDQNCVEKCAKKTRRVIEAGADRISAGASVTQVDAEIAYLIDHTLLKPEASRDEIRKLCQEAVRFGFASVCINPWYVPLAAELVHGSPVKVCTVVGFPLGSTLPQVKIREAEEVIKLGAEEVDMVINVGALKSRQDDVVESDIRGVVEACHRSGVICKVIIEAALLTADEKVRACLACKNAGADFVKTSTGFGPRGATVEDVRLLVRAVGGRARIKASGGIRRLADALALLEAGADRIGTSNGVAIAREARLTSP